MGYVIESAVNLFPPPKFLFPDAASDKPTNGSSSADTSNPLSDGEDYVSWFVSTIKIFKCSTFLEIAVFLI